MNKDSAEDLLAQLAQLQGVETSRELSKIITKIVDLISEEDMQIQLGIKKWQRAENCLEKMATLAELNIQDKQITKLRKEVLRILKDSTNKLVLASMPQRRN